MAFSLSYVGALGLLTVFYNGFQVYTCQATSLARNNINGLRPGPINENSDVWQAQNSSGTALGAAMPLPFPVGTWNITGFTAESDAVHQPGYFSTDANQNVEAWNLDGNGNYLSDAGSQYDTYGYEIYFQNQGPPGTGDLTIPNLADMNWLINNLSGFPIQLQVNY